MKFQICLEAEVPDTNGDGVKDIHDAAVVAHLEEAAEQFFKLLANAKVKFKILPL